MYLLLFEHTSYNDIVKDLFNYESSSNGFRNSLFVGIETESI